MKATTLDIDFEAELVAFQSQRSSGRAGGRHLSEIIHRIMAVQEPKRFGGEDPIDPLLAGVGFLWEDVMSMVLAKTLGWSQLETELDGILMTLDGLRTRPWRVLEAKASKMSGREPITSAKFRHWHYQAMGYAMAVDSLEAELWPFWINGGYELGGGRFGKPTVGREGRPYLLSFTRRERQENWDMIRRMRDRMDREEAA